MYTQVTLILVLLVFNIYINIIEYCLKLWKSFTTQLKNSYPQQNFPPLSPHWEGRFLPYTFNAIWKTLTCFTFPKRGVEIISKYLIFWLWSAIQFNTSKNEMSLKVLLVIWNGFLISTEYEFWRMKVFSRLHLKKGFNYSSIQNCLWVCLFVFLSLLDKCKRMT